MSICVLKPCCSTIEVVSFFAHLCAFLRVIIAVRGGGFVASKTIIKVAVVDDNIDAATQLSELLEMWGYTVRSAYDGPAALELANDFKPHVMLLDIGLPVMNGYEVDRKSTRLNSSHGYISYDV